MTKFLNKIKQILTPLKQEVETQTTLLQKKAGTYKVECSVDNEVVDCEEMKNTPYIGVPAPVVLSDDPWFGPSSFKSQKQLDYMEKEVEIKRKEQEENFSVEPDDIHQKMYEIATKNHSTTLDLNPPGGSENFHEGPGGWNSGNGWSQFK